MCMYGIVERGLEGQGLEGERKREIERGDRGASMCLCGVEKEIP